jgi:hypothetical protein
MSLRRTKFDAFVSGIGSTSMRSNENVAEIVLDILAGSSRFLLLNGGRLVTLVQTNDPNLRIGKLGGATPQWNRREWLDAKRRPDSR